MTQQRQFCGPSPIWVAVLEDSSDSFDIRWLRKGFDSPDSSRGGSMISSVSESPQLRSVAHRKDRARPDIRSLSYCALFHHREAAVSADDESQISYRDFAQRQLIRTQHPQAPAEWSSASDSSSLRDAPFLVPLDATDPPSSSDSEGSGASLSGALDDDDNDRTEVVAAPTTASRLSVRLTRAAVRGAKRLVSPRSAAVGARSATDPGSPRERLSRLGRSVSDRFMRRQRPAAEEDVPPRSRTPRGM